MQRQTHQTDASSELNGWQIDAVSAWLEARGETISYPLTARLILGGRSNYSHKLSANGQPTWVLRHAPTVALDSAHDMSREFRVLDSLQRSEVPVPRAIGIESDTRIVGAPFYVTEYMPGAVLSDLDEADRLMDSDQRRQAGQAFVSTLASIHDVDIASLDMEEFQHRESYVRRQLRRWSQQVEHNKIRDLPGFVEAAAILSQVAPDQPDQVLVHGDYRLDNLIIGDNCTVLAVIDWELWSVGEPLADLAISAAYWSDPDDEVLPLGKVASMADGFARRSQIVDAYSKATGRDITHFDFYMAFAYWRLVGILEGIRTRVVQGIYDTEIPGSEDLQSEVPKIARYALHLAKKLR